MKAVQKMLLVLKYLASKLQKMAIIETVISKGNFVKSVKRSLEVAINHPVLSMILSVFKIFTQVFGCLVSTAISTAITYVHIKYFFYNVKQPISFSCFMCFVHLVISFSILEMYTIGLSTYHYFIYHHRQDKLQMMERRASIESSA
ncbi:hypothetical protein RF11_06314 [Thelohanellus kitauei]|uniref:Uncharacterized protein n=1 Tax=Thelohanellus kitauei TaxID=669202 RepID=A0A0C2N2M7_THEKT|nr:hypothetical protein RF11_06314 [Thelohanellus kitauei]